MSEAGAQTRSVSALCEYPASRSSSALEIMAVFPAFPSTTVDMLQAMDDRFVFVRELLERAAAYLSVPLPTVIRQMERPLVERSSIPDHLTDVDALVGKSVDLTVLLAIYQVYQWTYGVAVVPASVGGDSVGLLASMAATGALSLEDALGVLAVWHRAAQKACRGRQLARLEIRGCAVRDAGEIIDQVAGAEIFRIPSEHRVSVVGERAGLQEIATTVAAHQGDATTSLQAGPRILPFHSALCVESVHHASEVLADIEINDPETDIVSTVERSRCLRTAEDVRSELLDLVYRPVDWRCVMESLTESGCEPLVIGRSERGCCLAGRSKTGSARYLATLDDIRDDKAALLRSRRLTDVYDRRRFRSALADRIMQSGGQVFLFDGYSGAGKTTLLSGVAEEMRRAGRPTLVIHCGDFICGATHDEIEAEHIRGRGRGRLYYPRGALHRYAGFRRLIRAMRTSRRTGKPLPLRLGGLWGPEHRDNSKTTSYVVHPETVLLLEGNVFMGAEVRGLVDAAYFIEADVVTCDDVDRVLTRTRGRRQKKLGAQLAAQYRNSVMWFRRPFVEEHRRRKLALFDYFVEFGQERVVVVGLDRGLD